LRVLIFEIHSYHYEIIPGFASLFLQSGYQVDCLLREAKDDGDVFCRCKELKKKIRIYNYENANLGDVLRDLHNENRYDIIFFSSIFIENKACLQAINQIENSFDPKPKLIGCCHGFELNDDAFKRMLLHFGGRIVALSRTETPYGVFPEVNPNVFCDIEGYGEKHDKTTIIGVGMRVNLNELTTVMNRLDKGTIHLIMVRKKENMCDQLIHILKYCVIRLFRLKKYDWTKHIPTKTPKKHAREEMEITGRIPFSELFAKVENSDFIVMNIYEGSVSKFSSKRTSGAKQLSLGFLKPCILEKQTADYYGFNERNAIVYNKGELMQAVTRAASMPREEYMEMVDALRDMREQVRKNSLRNLEKVLND